MPAERATRVPSADASTLLLDVPEADALLEAAGGRSPRGTAVLRPAHISLAFPWLAPGEAFASIDRLDAAARTSAPVPLQFDRVERFPPDRRGRTTLHLRLAKDEPVQALALVLGLSLPVPHLSVVRLPGTDRTDELEAVLRAHLPLPAVARTVQLRVRYGSWWRVEHVTHLGDRAGRPGTPVGPAPSPSAAAPGPRAG
ncbi:MAG: hypothetical protein K0R11_2351 [Acidimicrobiales bacterium]|nr:hypothetical protein [Acidimicrobiales bacterium]